MEENPSFFRQMQDQSIVAIAPDVVEPQLSAIESSIQEAKGRHDASQEHAERLETAYNEALGKMSDMMAKYRRTRQNYFVDCDPEVAQQLHSQAVEISWRVGELKDKEEAHRLAKARVRTNYVKLLRFQAQQFRLVACKSLWRLENPRFDYSRH